MARRKPSIGIYPMAPGLSELDIEHLAIIQEIIGRQMPKDFYAELMEELDGWLRRFGAFRELRYGNEERRHVEALVRAAARLLDRFEHLGEIGAIILDSYAYRHGVSNADFLAILADFNEAPQHLDELADEEINAAAFQIHAISNVLTRYGVKVTVTHDTGSVKFSPSVFTRLIDAIWDIDERLRLYQPISSAYWPNLSQWISARLWEEVCFDQLKLVHRKKLE